MCDLETAFSLKSYTMRYELKYHDMQLGPVVCHINRGHSNWMCCHRLLQKTRVCKSSLNDVQPNEKIKKFFFF